MSEFQHHEPRPGILALSGELTVEHARAAKELLLGALHRHEKLELDLMNVTRFDTAGVQLLLMLHQEAAQLGRQLVMLGHSLAVEEILELLDLSRLLGRPAVVVWS